MSHVIILQTLAPAAKRLNTMDSDIADRQKARNLTWPWNEPRMEQKKLIQSYDQKISRKETTHKHNQVLLMMGENIARNM